MLKYPQFYTNLYNRIEKKVTDVDLFQDKITELNRALKTLDTFTARNMFIKNYVISTERKIQDTELGEFWN